jgi:hypothetical protein
MRVEDEQAHLAEDKQVEWLLAPNGGTMYPCV